ncbi:hypothetical protein BDU57DRAFT_510238 [Ampelomyces quisqualis]|uniref:Uncharacterized protein n=1 Tax=Ampelomyces quisqualis TaxID=50730 RepID=A0A6A5R053_AMPQU|nr:hypothetical protein BDU57DRAFT_510238 [Ampelomyces quisqualis]
MYLERPCYRISTGISSYFGAGCMSGRDLHRSQQHQSATSMAHQAQYQQAMVASDRGKTPVPMAHRQRETRGELASGRPGSYCTLMMGPK